MRFYYFSLFSWMAYGVVCFVALVLLWVLWRKLFKQRITNPVFLVLVAAILVLPWTEELWIAYNFDRLCRKDAGVFINKTVEVDGFYDATIRSAYELTKAGGYKFVEHQTEDRKGIERVELATVAEREKALAWYEERNPGKQRPRDRSIFHPVNEKQAVAVLPNGVDAWKVTKLDKPTAQYQYTTPEQSTPVGYKIRKTERRVEGLQTGEILGREIIYARDAYWFFIHLDVPVMLCPAPGQDPREKHGLIYKQTLKSKPQ